jgi:SsrA-binding protein
MDKPNKIDIKNKKASFEYEFLERFTAGIKLTGTEIKSIRAGKANLADAYCYFASGELYVKGMNVSEYEWGTCNNHEPRRERKLLLNKKELIKLFKRSQEKGLTMVAYRLWINDRGLAKLDLALAKGKKQYDKREDIKKKDVQREMDRAMKQ